MPIVKSISEFQRNQSEMIKELKETAQPIYLTKNGSASIVVMDAEAFDREMAFKENLYKKEMAISQGVARGWADAQAGRVYTLDQAEDSLYKARGL